MHEEENSSGHLMLLFHTVMQLFSMVGKTMRESGPLSELNDHAYVRDDTMFLKVIVDTTDL